MQASSFVFETLSRCAISTCTVCPIDTIRVHVHVHVDCTHCATTYMYMYMYMYIRLLTDWLSRAVVVAAAGPREPRGSEPPRHHRATLQGSAQPGDDPQTEAARRARAVPALQRGRQRRAVDRREGLSIPPPSATVRKSVLYDASASIDFV